MQANDSQPHTLYFLSMARNKNTFRRAELEVLQNGWKTHTALDPVQNTSILFWQCHNSL